MNYLFISPDKFDGKFRKLGSGWLEIVLSLGTIQISMQFEQNDGWKVLGMLENLMKSMKRGWRDDDE